MKKLYNYSAEVTRVVDGDTFDCLVDMGMKVYKKARVRIMGINCPERGKPGFDESATWLRNKFWLEFPGCEVRVYLSSQGYDSFGRWLCWVWVEEDPNPFDLMNTLGEEMIKAGVAVRYVK